MEGYISMEVVNHVIDNMEEALNELKAEYQYDEFALDYLRAKLHQMDEVRKTINFYYEIEEIKNGRY